MEEERDRDSQEGEKREEGQEEQKGQEKETEEEGRQENCTYFVSGDRLIHQAIFRCLTCEAHSAPNSCCCAGCAEICHQGHEVEYLANSLAYCDCGKEGCALITSTYEKYGKSLISGERFLYGGEVPLSIADRPFEAHKFSNLLVDGDPFLPISHQCCEVVAKSKETFWVGCDLKYRSQAGPDDRACRCELEELALLVFDYHIGLLKARSPAGFTFNRELSGAEWWIQIKDLSEEGVAEKSPAIDLHYDKDEDIAESFDCGIFPSMSTVTYLNTQESHGAIQLERRVNPQPTVIFTTTCNDPIGTEVRDCFLSYPVIGKHVSFDGRLLHGAPADPVLRDWRKQSHSEGTVARLPDKRITFLVNIWLNHHPANIHQLPEEILLALSPLPSPFSIPSALTLSPSDPSDIYTIPVCDGSDDFQAVEGGDDDDWSDVEDGEESVSAEDININLEDQNDNMDKIELPFVTKDSTWAQGDESENLVVVMYLPRLRIEGGEVDNSKYSYPQLKFANNFDSYHIKYHSKKYAPRIVCFGEEEGEESDLIADV